MKKIISLILVLFIVSSICLTSCIEWPFNGKDNDKAKDITHTHKDLQPGTYGLHIYSNLDVLKSSNNNNGILAIKEFRQALSLAPDRADMTEKIWPSTSSPCLGLIDSTYYYDTYSATNPEEYDFAFKYRDTDEAKSTILEAYGVVWREGGLYIGDDLVGYSLDEACDAFTGYNLTLAKEKLDIAITELTNNANFYGYDSNKNITLICGASANNVWERSRIDYIENTLNTLTKGSSLEGKIKIIFDASAGDDWANAFRLGETQIVFDNGFRYDPLNPYEVLGAFVDLDNEANLHKYWDTSAIEMTLTLPYDELVEGAGQTITMSIQNWYYCLVGLAADKNQPCQYNWSYEFAPIPVRIKILAALEKLVLEESRTIILVENS